MPPKGYHQNFVSFIYLCYDKVQELYSLETNSVAGGGSERFTAKFAFELEASYGCYDMGKFISSIKSNKELRDLPTEVFDKWIRTNQEHLTHLPKTIWEWAINYTR